MKFLLSLLAVFVMFAAQPARAAESVGKITMSQGTVSLFQTGRSAATPATTGMALFRGDEIETGKGAAVAVTLTDGSTVAMGADGTFVIDDYLFDPAKPQQAKARFKLLRAAFAYTGGKLESAKGADVRLDLDFGSIGVRGTKLIRSMKDMECWIYLEEGAVTVSNDGGTVDLAPGQGTKMSKRSMAPTTPEAWTEEQVAWMRADLPQ